MGLKDRSPSHSEIEYDISNNLVDGRGSEVHTTSKPRDVMELGMESPASNSDYSEDENMIAVEQAAANRKASNLKGRSVKKGGGFQAMGLNATLLKAVTRKGFSVPTPIQRKTIPAIMDGQDVVAMARTGSGKTAAFVIPMIEKLKMHSAKVGARALILAPSRELALQTLKVVKEFGKGTDLRTILLVGGDSLDEQFDRVSWNPDVMVATPGRFLHLKIEMNLDLSSLNYVVFDEADRLFEMGFSTQLSEILHALPPSRQTLLFSATLPKSLVEFARAGLQDPKLVRLDTESKISPDLQSAFLTAIPAEKDGALLHLLQDIIKVPLQSASVQPNEETHSSRPSKKRKREQDPDSPNQSWIEFSTIIFAATKHHVEYLTQLLRSLGYAVSHVYGSLDQGARRSQIQQFRDGATNILVVTDLAARGIDIPLIANVINYDFPAQPKIFVHRVGRTARAGRTGWSYSIITHADLPYLLDLQLFLGKRLVLGRTAESPSFADDIIVGNFPRNQLEQSCESIATLLDGSSDLQALRTVASKGGRLYAKTKNPASSESAKRAKELAGRREYSQLNLLFDSPEANVVNTEREDMLARIRRYRPKETVFEMGNRGPSNKAAQIMRRMRLKFQPKFQNQIEREQETQPDVEGMNMTSEIPKSMDHSSREVMRLTSLADEESESADEMQITISDQAPHDSTKTTKPWIDSENFMSYQPIGPGNADERGYGVHSGSYNTSKEGVNFIEAAHEAAFDLVDDERKSFAEPGRSRGVQWDKKSKKYVPRISSANGAKSGKLIRGESGLKISASYRSGRFDAWRKANRIDRLPRVGEMESLSGARSGSVGTPYRHRKQKAPKEADKFRDDYNKRKKRLEMAKEKKIGRSPDAKAKSELRSVDAVRKQRYLKERRKEKNARPPKRS